MSINTTTSAPVGMLPHRQQQQQQQQRVGLEQDCVSLARKCFFFKFFFCLIGAKMFFFAIWKDL
jgi:hypothetical protein